MGCYDPFDLTRNDIISDEMVFDNPTLADAFLFDLYDRAQCFTAHSDHSRSVSWPK